MLKSQNSSILFEITADFRGRMQPELHLIWRYLKAVCRYWWLVIVGLGLTVMDFVERMFATWYQPPLWARVSTAIAGLVIAQYMAYRQLSMASASKSSLRNARLADTLKAGRGLLWEAKYRPATTSQEFSRWASQVDDWIKSTHTMLATELGNLAAESFLNDAGIKDVSYPGIPSDYHERLTFLNRRLENLHTIVTSNAAG